MKSQWSMTHTRVQRRIHDFLVGNWGQIWKWKIARRTLISTHVVLVHKGCANIIERWLHKKKGVGRLGSNTREIYYSQIEGNGVCGLQIWANPSLYRRRCWLIFPNQQDFRLPLNLGKSDPQPLIANLAKFVACRDLCKERAAVSNFGGNSGKAEFGGGFK